MVIVQQVLLLFLLLLVGYACRKLHYLTDEAISGITKLTLNVAMPAITIAKLQREFSLEVFENVILSFVCGLFFISLLFFLSFFLFRKRPAARRAALTNLIAFPNCAFMGYPLLQSVAPDWMIYAVAFTAAFNILSWTIGAGLYQAEKSLDIKRILLSPTIIASVLGLGFFIGQISLPPLLFSTLDILGSLCTPLSMLLIGARLSGLRLADFKASDYPLSALLSLLVAPLLTYVILLPFHLPPSVFAVSVLLMSMPPASSAAMQAELFEGDKVFCARAVAFSTILSLLTIPLISMLLF